MVCASSTTNYGTMVPFLVEMCIFAFPTTFVTSVFQFPHKIAFSIFQVAGGVKTGVFLKWPPRAMCKTSPLQIAWVGDLLGVPHLGS
jgi:hypothetical protein